MTPTSYAAPPKTAAPPVRLRATALLLLVLTVLLALLVVTVSSALAREYGDPMAGDVAVASGALRDWGVPVLLVVGLGALTIVSARRSRGRRWITVGATLAVAGTLLGVPAGSVLGVHRKLEAWPEAPRCTAGLATGPAAPVMRAAQAAFEEIEHPGKFSGGGESGVSGCASQLMVPGDVDVPAAYQVALPAAGWRLGRVGPDRVEATRDGQRFTASRGRGGAWWVRIGPEDALR